MQLRNRRSTPRQQAHKARRSSTQQDHSGAELPPGILYLLGDRLTCLEDVAAASAVCKSWAKHLRAGLSKATLCINGVPTYEADEPRFPPIFSLGKNSPSLAELQLLLCGRSGYEAVQQAVQHLYCLKSLQTLRLNFVVSQTPKKGSWPMFFSDNMDIGKIKHIIVEGSSMPLLAVTNLLTTLQSSKDLKSLQLLMGRPHPGSQLPSYKPPAWLQVPVYYCTGPTALHEDQLDSLCSLSSLEQLTFEPDASIPAASFAQLSKLKALTSLVLNGTVHKAVLHRLAEVKQLRRLQVDVRFSDEVGRIEAEALDHVQQLDFGLTAVPPAYLSFTMQHIHPVLSNLSSCLQQNLKGLCLNGFAWCKTTVDHLTALTGLTSLQLLQVTPGTTAGSLQLDLTPLGKLKNMQKFALQCVHDSPIIAVRFGVYSEQEGSRRHSSSSSQSSSKRARKQKTPSVKDMSGLAKVWPNLHSLQLSHLSPSAVHDTCWDLKQLTALTSLCLQFTPTADLVAQSAAVEVAASPETPSFLETVTVKLRLDQMPPQLQLLQLMGCSLLVPYFTPFSDTLTSLSLSHCWLQSCWDLQLQRCCLPLQPTLTPAAARNNAVPIITTPGSNGSSSGGTSNNSSESMLQHPLVVLLQHLPALQQLELAEMHHTQLHDGLLAAVTATRLGATAHGPSLRGLTSLSVLGVGNSGMTHGGLLGLTRLKKLRVLRWHVGDALELMPDLGALAQLKGLVALHIPTWLHAQMERWGAYAVLDSMPFCDVHVEST